MTTLVFVENVLGSSEIVRLVEDFGDHADAHDLRPGENARLVVSAFKTLTLQASPGPPE